MSKIATMDWGVMPPPPDIHHHPKILQTPMQNIVVCKCAKYQGNPANISRGIPTFNIIIFIYIYLFISYSKYTY